MSKLVLTRLCTTTQLGSVLILCCCLGLPALRWCQREFRAAQTARHETPPRWAGAFRLEVRPANMPAGTAIGL
jgi:hypothetical protein